MKKIIVILKYYKNNVENIKKIVNFFFKEIENATINRYFDNEEIVLTNKEEFFYEISKKEYKDAKNEISIEICSNSLEELSIEKNLYILYLSYENYEKNQKKIDSFFDDYAQETKVDCIFLNELKYFRNQRIENIEKLKKKGITISKDKILEVNGEKKIDVRKNAGYITYVKEIPVGVAWKMWLGNNYYNWIPKETLVEFKDCYQNIEIGNNIQKIIMTKTLEEFTNDKTDDIKWNFRKKLNLNSITEKIEEFEKKKEISSDEEIFEAFFVDKKYYEIRYFDKKGRSIEKKYAKFYKVEEYDLVENEKVRRFLGETIGKIENLDIEKLKKGYYRRTEYNDVLKCLKIIKNGERINKFDTEIMLQNIADYEKKEILEKVIRYIKQNKIDNMKFDNGSESTHRDVITFFEKNIEFKGSEK
ncbi:hypothetical protein JCM16775_1755 [Leptotrichia hofstadii]|uniref:Uncharacterized protein n=1 Tax=Leptotrichia hofstadii TaxID=157688 RepID=A0A510JID8_9FUSO|nr:hypothetical protein [Leptotrichia hofstadii]BBM39044.1 hypothetical protein JCM16775_1755 [Leptotrichia hofstadii]